MKTNVSAELASSPAAIKRCWPQHTRSGKSRRPLREVGDNGLDSLAVRDFDKRSNICVTYLMGIWKTTDDLENRGNQEHSPGPLISGF